MREVYLPASLDDLWRCLDDHPNAVFFAGGTDLFVKTRAGKVDAPVFIGLERIAELKGIREDAGNIRIGAVTTHSNLLSHPAVAHHLPVLKQALLTLGSPPIRTMGTLGGNLCSASPAGDTLPPLYVLRAWVETVSASETRLIPIVDFISGPGQTRLKPGEIVAAIHVQKPAGVYLHHFEKVGQRKSMACAVASLAALIGLTSTGIITEARLAWGSVGPKVVTSPELEAWLIGKTLSRETLSAAAAIASRAVCPIDDIRASAEYRRFVSGRLLMRLLTLVESSDAVPTSSADPQRTP
jgi:CO/xanthine dehydrogenase FAD-binding subunit